MLLLGLATPTSAQSDPAEVMQEFLQRSLADRHRGLTREINTAWNENGSHSVALNLLRQEDLREGIGVSDEQYQNIRTAVEQQTSVSSNDIPAAKLVQAEITKLMNEVPGQYDEFDANAPNETKMRIAELREEVQRLMGERASEIINARITNAISENLMPNQLRKVQEFQISAMSELSYSGEGWAYPSISPSMFEALDLSDTQRQQFGDIKKEMEPEIKKWMDRTIEAQLKIYEKRQAKFRPVPRDPNDPQSPMQLSLANPVESWNEVRRENPDLQRELNEALGAGGQLADKLKVRMFDVLTDEQWARMIDLIDNPPDYAKKWIAKRRMGRENASNSGEWAPGPNSWQPGDPIPEAYRIERKTRGNFPRPKQPSP